MNKFGTLVFKDPLVHFLLLGAIIFGADAAITDSRPESDRVIDITEADIGRLTKGWQMQWQRFPTADELRDLMEAEVREQVFYREAQRLGLEENDAIVQRRLVQKLEFLIEAERSIANVPDEVLGAYFQENQRRYEIPAKLTFSHIYFSTDIRPDARNAALAVLGGLRDLSNPPIRAPKMGDRFYLAHDYVSVDSGAIDRDFGAGFAEQLLTYPIGQWSGPVESGLGWHLIYISNRVDVRDADLAVVRKQVLSDYLYDRRNEAIDEAYLEMRERYEIHMPHSLIDQS